MIKDFFETLTSVLIGLGLISCTFVFTTMDVCGQMFPNNSAQATVCFRQEVQSLDNRAKALIQEVTGNEQSSNTPQAPSL